MTTENEILQTVDEARSRANSELAEFPSQHKFEMAEVFKDRSGNETKVLIIETDKPGLLGEYMDYGNPFSYQTDGDLKEEKGAIGRYMRFMSNIDLERRGAMEAVGWSAISKAREVVRGFFILRLVSELPEVSTGKPDAS